MSDRITPSRNDSPATLLGPTALVLGVMAFLGTWPVPLLFPFTLLAGALAVTLGLAGAHYARQGVGRMWPAVAGTVLGAAGFVFPVVLLTLMY